MSAPRFSAPRIPAHLAVLAGLSAGLYSGGLTVVSVLQADEEAARIAAAEPPGAELAKIRAENAALEATIATLETGLEPLAAAADRAEAQASLLAAARYDLELALADLTEELTGVRVPVATRPSGTGSGTGSGSAATAAAPIPAPAMPPATVATTGASGAP